MRLKNVICGFAALVLTMSAALVSADRYGVSYSNKEKEADGLDFDTANYSTSRGAMIQSDEREVGRLADLPPTAAGPTPDEEEDTVESSPIDTYSGP